ncbi:MAG: SgcJ/EcaC family oxidoreductase [Rubripirellula sp.]|nr:SgcJ/EcaC family oxidoreductase [Rubripirellula sp.]
MKQRLAFSLLSLAVTHSVFFHLTATAQDVTATAQDVTAKAQEDDATGNALEALRSAGKLYVQAFNTHDAKALSKFWSPQAVYINRLTGEQVSGREAISAQFEIIFKAKQGLQLDVDVQSLEFVSPNVAVENGTATLSSGAAEPRSVDYSAVYIRSDGQWLLDRVTDDPQPLVQSNYQQLKDLEWMIGSWVDQADDGQVATDCRWSKNKNFVVRTFTVSVAGRIGLSGIQFVGWDPANNQIRSWTFDSDGGFSEGRWSKDANRWYVRKQGTTSDGSRATAVNIITYVDDNTFTLKSTQRTLAGDLQPNVDEVVVVKQ